MKSSDLSVDIETDSAPEVKSFEQDFKQIYANYRKNQVPLIKAQKKISKLKGRFSGKQVNSLELEKKEKELYNEFQKQLQEKYKEQSDLMDANFISIYNQQEEKYVYYV